MDTPTRAGDAPIKCDLETDKNYFWCSCGLSKNQPYCDGSHKTTNLTPKSFKVEKQDAYYLCTCKKTGNAPFCDGSHNK